MTTMTDTLQSGAESALDLDKLEALARAATPGEWTHQRQGVIVAGPLRQYANGSAQSQIASFGVTNTEDDEPERQIANANFCAAANPASVLALLALARRATAPHAEPVAYVNGDELDNMLDDRTATIQTTRTGYRATALYRGPVVPAVGGALVAKAEPLELMAVREQIEQGAGFWHSCSGCHETEDGHPVGQYAYSNTLGCALGNGCTECGGIGAVWDNNDYEAMAKALDEDAAPTESAAAPADDFARGVIAALGVLNAHGYPHGSVYHDEIVQSVGEASIYAAAEEDDYRWAGLDPSKNPRATQPTGKAEQGEQS